MLNHQIKNGQLDSVKRIVKLNPNLLNKQDELGNTPLHYALKYGRYEITQELLKEGAVVYIENNSGDTAYKNWTNDNTGIINFIKNMGKNKGLSDKEVLAKAVALKVVQITEQIQVLEENILNTPMERYNIIYKSLSTLIQQDINDEIRNEVITKILKRSDSDMEIYIINKGSKEGLILQALLKKDYKLLDVILKNLLEKSPEDREDIYKFFVNELLTAASEKDIIMGLEVILNLPDDDKNALLSLKHKGQPLPSEIAFKNKHYKVMEHILNLSPKNVSLEMMDYILKNKLPCAKKVFDENQELIAKSIMNEENKTAIRYLTYIWHRPSSNDFDLQLFKTYFLNASGEVINLFLTGNNNKGFIYNYQITIEELVKKLNDDELATFIDTKLEFLSDSLKMSLLALEITKGNIKNIRKIINANPNLLILQLPEHNNNTPLHMAINKKEWPIACYFMSKDCLVNLENNSKHTAFNDWVAAGNKTKSDDAAFELILETGSPSEIQSATSRISGTILIMMHFHKQEVEKLLQKANQPEEKIKIIVDRIQMILHPSHNLSNKGMMTEEAYLNATKDIIVELAKDLTTLEDIFSYKLPNTKGNTLLHQAISTKNTILTEFILNYFGTHDLLNDEGNTPLHLAIINKDPNLNKLLIENEALVNIQNGEGNTLLHLTIINKDLPLTTMLLEKVESLDLKNKEGKTASDLIESAGQSKAYGLGIFKPVSLIGAKSVEFKALLELQRSKVDSDALPGPDNHEESNTLAMGPPK
jgi:ankyrin repeat protein